MQRVHRFGMSAGNARSSECLAFLPGAMSTGTPRSAVTRESSSLSDLRVFL